jgi:hypothetical protein
VEEAETLREEPGAVKKRDMPHLINRVLATALQVRELRRKHDEELRRRTEFTPKSRAITTLSPEQAARFLSREQLTRLFDKYSQEQLSALELLQNRAAENLQSIESCVDEAVTVMLHAANDPGVPGAVGEQLRAIVDRLTAVRNKALDGEVPS